jgi:hypothetical protein
MKRSFKIGDHVGWNSEAGRVGGTIINIHYKNLQYKGYIHHASRRIPNTKSKAIRRITLLFHKAPALTLRRR